MIDREHDLALTRQAKLLKLTRSGLYCRPRPVPPADLAVMRRIDELHLDYPFAGSRMLRDLLRGESVAIGRQRVATMMRRMGIEGAWRDKFFVERLWRSVKYEEIYLRQMFEVGVIRRLKATAV